MRSLLRKLAGGESGLGLTESLIALAVMGLVAVAILTSLATGAKAAVIAREQAFAESLARSEIEYIKGHPYITLATQYPVDPSLAVQESDGWLIPSPSVVQLNYGSGGVQETTLEDNGFQKVTVTIQRYGRTILAAVTYKVDR